MNEFLTKEWEFFQLLIFQGRFGSFYSVIAPHSYSDKIRAILTEGGDSALDYEVVIEAEKLITADETFYPGAHGTTIEDALDKLKNKFEKISTDGSVIYGMAVDIINKLEHDYGV